MPMACRMPVVSKERGKIFIILLLVLEHVKTLALQLMLVFIVCFISYPSIKKKKIVETKKVGEKYGAFCLVVVGFGLFAKDYIHPLFICL